mmetsp:Transcript_97998/g.292771  ORF Transcript_97998/g.292771 Transcript_97998/m.292771 type:complete len:214 (+) Transcript_97998:708-1349(+)
MTTIGGLCIGLKARSQSRTKASMNRGCFWRGSSDTRSAWETSSRWSTTPAESARSRSTPRTATSACSSRRGWRGCPVSSSSCTPRGSRTSKMTLRPSRLRSWSSSRPSSPRRTRSEEEASTSGRTQTPYGVRRPSMPRQCPALMNTMPPWPRRFPLRSSTGRRRRSSSGRCCTSSTACFRRSTSWTPRRRCLLEEARGRGHRRAPAWMGRSWL